MSVRFARSRPLETAVGVVLASVLVAAGLHVWAGADLRGADVRLTAAHDASVTGADGVTRSLLPGAALRDGDVVRTGRSGSATLVASGRRVVLGPESVVAVPDALTMRLERGSVLLDRREGPGISLRAGPVVVDDISDGAVRVERGFSVGVQVYSGAASVGTSTGRSLRVRALHEVSVAARSLPRAARPLTLARHDGTPAAAARTAWEREVIGTVVRGDANLTRLAAGLNRTRGLGTVAAVRPLLPGISPRLLALPATEPASEILLPVAIGRAGRGGDTGSRITAAAERRAAGGSWGVVAALARARVADVASALATVVGSPASSVTGGNRRDASASDTSDSPRARPRSTPAPSGAPRPSARPRPSTSPAPSASPSPSDGPAGGIVDAVESLLPSLPSLPVG